MTRYDVAVLSLRILALYFWFSALTSLAQLVGILSLPVTEPLPIVAWSLPIGVLTVIGGVLFWKAPTFARSLFPGDESISTASRPEIGALALKVVGILIIVQSLSHAGTWIRPDGGTNWIRVAAEGTSCALGLGCFFCATWLSKRMFGTRGSPMPQLLLAHVQAVTFSVLGIWLFATSIASVTESVRERIELGAWGRGSWPQIALAILGLALFFGGVGLSAFWYWVRHAGLNSRTERPA